MKEMLNLGQQDYVKRIEELNQVACLNCVQIALDFNL